MGKKIELVAPGGSLEKIEYAFHYGADAVYLGLPDFSLRSRINEFNERKLAKAVALARTLGKKIYFTMNIYAHERHLPKIEKHLRFIKKIKPDAIIVSDPGILRLVRDNSPNVKIHLSTQANATNSEAVKFWKKQGVSRVILARETTLPEIREIRKKAQGIELECFVHGAMCVSYSGRCLLSKWLRGRDANLGDCVQPCRWSYRVARNAKPEAQNKEIILTEDEHGTYLLNSKDLCLIEYLDQLAVAGVSAFKIEGRTKSVYYVGAVTGIYRKAIDAIGDLKNNRGFKKVAKNLKSELQKISNRGYSSGFIFGKEKWEIQPDRSHAKINWQFAGQIIGLKKPSSMSANWHSVKVHNSISIGETVEIVTKSGFFKDQVLDIKNNKGEKLKSAHGGHDGSFLLKFHLKYGKKALLRKKLRCA